MSKLLRFFRNSIVQSSPPSSSYGLSRFIYSTSSLDPTPMIYAEDAFSTPIIPEHATRASDIYVNMAVVAGEEVKEGLGDTAERVADRYHRFTGEIGSKSKYSNRASFNGTSHTTSSNSSSSSLPPSVQSAANEILNRFATEGTETAHVYETVENAAWHEGN